MTPFFAVPVLVVALASSFQSSIRPLPAPVRAELRHQAWHPGCPVPLSGLRLLTVSYRGFDGRTYTGQLGVNQAVAAPLARVFHQLYLLPLPIRHMSLADAYGPAS